MKSNDPSRNVIIAYLSLGVLLILFVVYSYLPKPAPERRDLSQEYRFRIASFLVGSHDEVLFQKLIKTMPQTKIGQLPLLELAVLYRRPNCLKYLLESKIGEEGPDNLLSLAVEQNDILCAEILIKNNFPINTPSNDFAPIHYAVMGKERIDALKFLLKNHADINARIPESGKSLKETTSSNPTYRDKRAYVSDLSKIAGNTPIFTAIACNSPKSVEILIKNGCDLKAKNSAQLTVLQWIEYLKKNYKPGLFLPEPAALDQMKQLILKGSRS